MPDSTPTPSLFQDSYLDGTPPWVIGEPQPAVVALEGRGALRGPVLDVGTGAGEHTILLAGLGYDVLGVDAAPAAIDQARALAAERGVDARFAVADLLDPAGLEGFATVLDSALFHIFAPADRPAYADALARVIAPGGRLVVLALAVEGGSGFGPEVTESAVTDAFTAPTWAFEGQEKVLYRGRVTTDDQVAAFDRPPGTHVDLPAWQATLRRAG